MIELYTKNYCPYCVQAKMLLNKWDIPFKEYHIESKSGAKEFLKMQGHTTVPQIYRNGRLLVEGGYDGLVALGKQQLNERLGNINVSDFKL